VGTMQVGQPSFTIQATRPRWQSMRRTCRRSRSCGGWRGDSRQPGFAPRHDRRVTLLIRSGYLKARNVVLGDRSSRIRVRERCCIGVSCVV
jgi:hypothetical protein